MITQALLQADKLCTFTHLCNRQSSSSEKRLCLKNRQEGVTAFTPKSSQEGLHHWHDGLVKTKPLHKAFQILLPKCPARKKSFTVFQNVQQLKCPSNFCPALLPQFWSWEKVTEGHGTQSSIGKSAWFTKLPSDCRICSRLTFAVYFGFSFSWVC